MKSRTSLSLARLRAVAVGLTAAVFLSAWSVGDQGADPQRVEPGPVSSVPGQSTDSPDASEPTVQRTEIVTVGDIACDPTSPVFDHPQYCRDEEVAKLTRDWSTKGQIGSSR